MSDELKLDWTTAQVKEGELAVKLDGKLPKGWRQSFETTARLLDHGQWSELTVKKGLIRVRGASSGDEERLRHFLESAVRQANADVAVVESNSPEDRAAENEAGADEADREAGPDAEMTERFRSFAGGASDSGD